MITRKLAVRNSAQHPVASMSERRLSGGLHGMGLLLGLFFLVTCEARQQSSAVPFALAQVAASASLRPDESRIWMVVGERRFVVILSNNMAGHTGLACMPSITGASLFAFSIFIDILEVLFFRKRVDLVCRHPSPGWRTVCPFHLQPGNQETPCTNRSSSTCP